MKKFLLGSLSLVAVVAIVGYVLREPLIQKFEAAVTGDMFVDADDDSYDPGIAVGATFPRIHARTSGGTVTAIDEFIADRGMIFIAVRSADW